MRIQLRVFPGLIMFVSTQNPWEDNHHGLSDVKVRSAKPEAKAYKLTDDEGMVLLVHPNGSKYWRLRYRFGGKEKMRELEKYPEV